MSQPDYLASAQRRMRQVLEEFCGLLAIPNSSESPEDLVRCASKVRQMLESRGFSVRLVERKGAAPLVLGKLDVGGSKTIGLYSHYDGQPAREPNWVHEPWNPTLYSGKIELGGTKQELGSATLDSRLYARSTSDDKAPTQAICSALDLLSEAGQRPSVNLVVVTEGEEECGSPNFAALMEGQSEIDEIDAWLILDGPVHPSGRLQVVLGARGVVSLDFTVFGPTRTLHSGHYGNFVPNPAMRLVHLLASMRDERGFAAIAGFGQASSQEGNRPAALTEADAAFLREVHVPFPEDGSSGLEESISRPAINLHGIQAGHVQREATNAIMQRADASVDIRLVPGQTFEETKQAFERHIAAQGFRMVTDDPTPEDLAAHDKTVLVRWGSGYAAWRTDMDSPFAKALSASARALDPEVMINPMIGGSVPVAKVAARRGKPVAILPIANHDNNQHGANENIVVGNLIRGIALYAAVFSTLDWDA